MLLTVLIIDNFREIKESRSGSSFVELFAIGDCDSEQY